MINLLPPQEKELLREEEKFRLVLILGIVFLLFFVSLVLILFSVKNYIAGQVEYHKVLGELEKKEAKSFDTKNLEKEITDANQNLSKLQVFYKNKLEWSNIIEKIAQFLPEEMYLTNISIIQVVKKKKDKKEKIKELQISLNGFAPTRQLLYQFKKSLESEETFQEVYFPPSNWVNSQDIDFQVTLTLKL